MPTDSSKQLLPSSDATLTTRVLSGFKWTYLSAIVNVSLRFIVLSVLAHLLWPRDFGLIGIALIFTSFAERVGQLGVGPAVIQRTTLSSEHIRTAFSLSMLTGIAVWIILALSSPGIAWFFDEPELETIMRVVGLIFVIDGFSIVSESILQRELRFKALMAVENGSYFLGSVVVGITLAWLGAGVWSLVAALLVGRITKLAMLLWLVPQRVSFRFPRQEVKDLVTLGAGFSLGKLLTYGALQGDNFVVGRVLGTGMLGMYTRAYQLMTLPAICFGQVLDKVLFPAMAKRQDDPATLNRIYLTSIEAIGLAAWPVAMYMYVAAEEIILVVFGAKWVEIIPVLKILALGIFFRTAYKSSDTIVRALGAVYRHAARQAVYVTFVISGALFGSQWGLEGVATAILLAVFINYALMAQLSGSLIKLNWSAFARAHLPGLWVASLGLLTVFPLLSSLRDAEIHPLMRGLVSGSLWLTVSGLSFWFAPGLFRSERTMEVLKKLRR